MLAGVSGLLHAPAALAAGVKAVDVPAGYGYPGDRKTLQQWADQWAIQKIGNHAWDLWAGMTADSGQSWNGAPLPVWDTWCGDEEAFSGTCLTAERGGPLHRFRIARQLSHVAKVNALKSGSAPAAPVPNDTRVVSFNKFNPPMSAYLARKHAGPGKGGPYDYTSQQSLVNLNAAWPASAPAAARNVEETPYQPGSGKAQGFSAIETKPVFFIVKGSGLTPLGLWQGPAGSTNQVNPTPETWTTCVLIDPKNPAGPDTAPVPATPAQVGQIVKSTTPSACKTYLYAPVSVIWGFKMDAGEADAWNAVAPNSGDGGQGLTAEAGDYAVLAGMHVNTKEIVNWTWETFWWQPGGNPPGNFPGSKDGMTDKVKGPWRNYAMCTAWSQTKGAKSSTIDVCFNPYLETSPGIPAGITSNCMSCHGTATVGPAAACTSGQQTTTAQTQNYPNDYKKPVTFAFPGFTKTDFSWAIPGNARADIPCTNLAK